MHPLISGEIVLLRKGRRDRIKVTKVCQGNMPPSNTLQVSL